ncbi:Rad4-domain-containing protein [Neocallimastix californiae]|uniref:Rad4-domain-containing protein n=1 Tax=Neocallimastix californiae TaxID=1754190 RepID=A0A1Y2EUL2_9FUNG|nr:Rad4-domain-containing protein [Neocallimastix californiae]|eukprot:ORY75207.1 Rad4-domain-containing protein [Neocallimastix californiae]
MVRKLPFSHSKSNSSNLKQQFNEEFLKPEEINEVEDTKKRTKELNKQNTEKLEEKKINEQKSSINNKEKKKERKEDEEIDIESLDNENEEFSFLINENEAITKSKNSKSNSKNNSIDKEINLMSDSVNEINKIDKTKSLSQSIPKESFSTDFETDDSTIINKKKNSNMEKDKIKTTIDKINTTKKNNQNKSTRPEKDKRKEEKENDEEEININITDDETEDKTFINEDDNEKTKNKNKSNDNNSYEKEIDLFDFEDLSEIEISSDTDSDEFIIDNDSKNKKRKSNTNSINEKGKSNKKQKIEKEISLKNNHYDELSENETDTEEVSDIENKSDSDSDEYLPDKKRIKKKKNKSTTNNRSNKKRKSNKKQKVKQEILNSDDNNNNNDDDDDDEYLSESNNESDEEEISNIENENDSDEFIPEKEKTKSKKKKNKSTTNNTSNKKRKSNKKQKVKQEILNSDENDNSNDDNDEYLSENKNESDEEEILNIENENDSDKFIPEKEKTKSKKKKNKSTTNNTSNKKRKSNKKPKVEQENLNSDSDDNNNYEDLSENENEKDEEEVLNIENEKSNGKKRKKSIVNTSSEKRKSNKKQKTDKVTINGENDKNDKNSNNVKIIKNNSKESSVNSESPKVINKFKILKSLAVEDNFLSEDSEDEEDEEEWEKVEVSTSNAETDKEIDKKHKLSSSDNLLLSNQSITITFDKNEVKKKKGKGINKYDRIVRELTHKVNLLCLLSSCKIWNNWINTYEIKCIGLSVIPIDILKIVNNNFKFKLDDFTSSLNQFCKWFRSFTGLDRKDVEESGISIVSNSTSRSSIQSKSRSRGTRLRKKKDEEETDEEETDEANEKNEKVETVNNKKDKEKFMIRKFKDLEILFRKPVLIEKYENTRNLYVILFVTLARIAGYRCNFVASLHPIPLSFAKKKNHNNEAIELWTEIYCKKAKRWIPVNPLNSHSVYSIPKQLITSEFNEISYIITIDEDGFIKERTKRYAKDFLTFTRKLRLKNDAKWWEVNVIKRYFTTNVIDDSDEEVPDETEEKEPLPTSISGFLNHPLYVLERHIKKYEVLYSKEPVLGYIRNEAIYPRSNVRPVNTKEYWIRQGLSIKEGAKAAKYIKSRGIVPKSQFGNIDMFKPSMLPEGGTHLQIQGLGPLARKLNIDFANAVIGFDFRLGHCVPIIDGIVVATENVDKLLSKFEEFELEKFKKYMEKREKRILSNWRRLVKGLLTRERLNEKYGNEAND